MKHLSTALIALFLAALIALTLPAHVFAATSRDGKYVSEVQIGVGKTAAEAEKALEDYEILKDDSGNYADLNKSAGATGTGSKGDRVVYMGIKFTRDRSQAITDLAVMNMKGGYSVEDYEALLESNIKEQIIPFVNVFLAAIEEYRENYNSSNASNKQRATYIHDALNKFTADDCGGAGLGDLLLNETKYEMGDEAYNALSAAEKKKHADIITIIAQANGKATLMLENLLTRAADTGENSWLDRFIDVNYDDLLDETELPLSKAKKQLAKEYDDSAKQVLDLWDDFRDQMLDYENNKKKVESTDIDKLNRRVKELESQIEYINSLNTNGEYDNDIFYGLQNLNSVMLDVNEYNTCVQNLSIHDTLKETEYNGSTLLDFFTCEKSKIEEDVTVLYPLAASLSEGQRAGLCFVSLREMIVIALTDGEAYKDFKIDELKELSVYDGVNREIYEKGGVALTSDALRTDALKMSNDEGIIKPWTMAAMIITGAAFVAFAGSGIAWATYASKAKTTNNLLQQGYGKMDPGGMIFDANGNVVEYGLESHIDADLLAQNTKLQSRIDTFTARTTTCKYMTVGLGIALVILIGITTYLTYRDMVNRYNVEFTPIPRYMVDEKDITGYNAKGEKIVLKNQAAYYKAAFCNRKSGDEMYKNLANVADLNGDVGKQWLALYAARNEAEAPILARSFKITYSEEIPAGYTLGIHSFGSDAAENLNNTLYVWNSAAPKVFVYFKTDANAVTKTTGSSFTAGNVVLSGTAGLALGALATALGMTATGKKKKTSAA